MRLLAETSALIERVPVIIGPPSGIAFTRRLKGGYHRDLPAEQDVKYFWAATCSRRTRATRHYQPHSSTDAWLTAAVGVTLGRCRRDSYPHVSSPSRAVHHPLLLPARVCTW